MALEDYLDPIDIARLEKTQSLRERIINTMTADEIPTDKHDQAFLIKALDGLDRTVLAKSKLRIEDQSVKNQQDTSKLIGEILAKHNVAVAGVRTLPTSLPSHIVVTDIVEGETDLGIINQTYEDFTK